MQECRVCGLLFLGGGACPTCGSQVSMDISVDDIVMDDEAIPGLEEIADAIGDATLDDGKGAVLPFGLGAKAEVIESSLPFGVGSFTSDVNEVAIPFSESDIDSESTRKIEESVVVDSKSEDFEAPTQVDGLAKSSPVLGLESNDEEFRESYDYSSENESESIPEIEPEIYADIDNNTPSSGDVETPLTQESNEAEVLVDFTDQSLESQPSIVAEDESTGKNDTDTETTANGFGLAEAVPDMWKIDAAEVDMEAIYSQEEQIVEVSFDNELDSGDVQVTFDDFHHSPVEESMASDEDAPELHPAKALPVESSGQPEIANLVNTAFEHMANSSWMQAAQILSTASNNRPNDPAILNNLGLALLQSALEMDSKNDPMSSSQYEAAIMALRQGAKVDSNNNTILLNLSHALLVSGRAEKSLKVINVLRGRETKNVEVENVLGACLIQLGRDEEAQSILAPYASDSVVSGNLSLI